MKIAHDLGIAPRRLWGWEPKQVTKHRYKKGRIVDSVTTTEPEWDAESVELITAFAAIEADRHTCGHLLSESSSLAANPDNRKRTIDYIVEPPGHCFACEAIKRAQSAEEYSGENADSSRLWSVKRVERG